MYKHENASYVCVCGERQYGGEHVRSCVMQGQTEKHELHTIRMKERLLQHFFQEWKSCVT